MGPTIDYTFLQFYIEKMKNIKRTYKHLSVLLLKKSIYNYLTLQSSQGPH